MRCNRRVRLTAPALLVASLPAACGQTPVLTTTHRQDVLRSGLLVAPTPLFADSPLTPVGAISLEGGVSFAQRGPAVASRPGGAGGHLIPDVSVRMRIAWRPRQERNLELALAGMGAPGAWASSHATDLRADTFSSEETFFVGPQVRAVFDVAPSVQVGLSLSALLGRVPWSRTVDETVFVADGLGGMRLYDRDVETKTDGSFTALLGAAGFVTGDVSRYLTLLGGFSVQTQPYVRGFEQFVFRCMTEGCGEPRADTTPEVDLGGTGLLFASVTVRLGPVAIVGRAHGVLFGPGPAVDPGRFGGGIDLRGTFSP